MLNSAFYKLSLNFKIILNNQKVFHPPQDWKIF